MTKLFVHLWVILCCGCIDVCCNSETVAITFVDSDNVIVKGEVYDVSNKEKSFRMRCGIKSARELVFEHVEKASARTLWNIIDPVSNVSNHDLLSPAVYSIRLESGSVLPVYFGPRCSYFVEGNEDDYVGMSVGADIKITEIDFSIFDSTPYVNAYLEVKCDLSMSSCENLERILMEFAKHGSGDHPVFLLFY